MSMKNRSLRRMKSLERSGSAVRFSVEADGVLVTVELSIPAARIIRYKILPVEESSTERFDLLEPGWVPGQDGPSIDDSAERIILEAYGTKVEVTRDPWTVMVRDQDGRPAFYEVDPSFDYPHEIDPRGRPRHYRSGFGVNGNETTACRVVFGLDPEESLFGLGEKFTSIDKRGQRIVVWNHGAQGTSTELAYKNIPFMVS